MLADRTRVRAVRWEGPDGYWASDDRELINLAWVQAWLSEKAYWALGRPHDVIAHSIERSMVMGLYSAENERVGFARVVTDSSTFGWLCDVFVDAAHEGHGLGSFLVATTTSHPSIRGIRLLLSATPGRTLYARHGFTPLDSADRWMVRSAAWRPRDRDSTEAGG